MGAYDNDPRVRVNADGTFTLPDTTARRADGDWVIEPAGRTYDWPFDPPQGWVVRNVGDQGYVWSEWAMAASNNRNRVPEVFATADAALEYMLDEPAVAA